MTDKNGKTGTYFVVALLFIVAAAAVSGTTTDWVRTPSGNNTLVFQQNLPSDANVTFGNVTVETIFFKTGGYDNGSCRVWANGGKMGDGC